MMHVMETKTRKILRIILIVALVVTLVLILCLVFRGSGRSEESASESDHVPAEPMTKLASVTDTVAAAVSETSGWLELPAVPDDLEGYHVVTHRAEMEGRQQRNYTILYDEDLFAAVWVAYPLCDAHMSSGREETWAYDPKLPESIQTSVRRGYGASIPTKNYPGNFYARGHQIPNADRSAVPQMQAQTYYSTNMTPQIQNGFNGAIWAKLEEAVRSAVPDNDTLYVVTGASFVQVDQAEPLKTIVNKNDSKILPVPSHYWKALLKVKRDGKGIVAAKTIGFWLKHDDLKDHSYDEFVVTVDQIEERTGIDLFTNLSDSVESSAESQTSWASFRSY